MTILDNASTYIQAHKRSYRKSADHTVHGSTGPHMINYLRPYRTKPDHKRLYKSKQVHIELNRAMYLLLTHSG